MYFSLACLLVLGFAFAEPQLPYYHSYYNPFNNPLGYGVPNFGPQYDSSFQKHTFRAGYPYPSYDLQESLEGVDNRFLFGTVTLTLATTTRTTTITQSTTCTTSTGVLTICSPSGGRRRRGISLKSRGLFYNDEEEAQSMFANLPEPEKPSEAVEVERTEREVQPPLVPFVIQPGFSAPDGRQGRFLVAFGTKTILSTTTSTYTAFLTADCASTSGFATCSGNGK